MRCDLPANIKPARRRARVELEHLADLMESVGETYAAAGFDEEEIHPADAEAVDVILMNRSDLDDGRRQRPNFTL